MELKEFGPGGVPLAPLDPPQTLVIKILSAPCPLIWEKYFQNYFQVCDGKFITISHCRKKRAATVICFEFRSLFRVYFRVLHTKEISATHYVHAPLRCKSPFFESVAPFLDSNWNFMMST